MSNISAQMTATEYQSIVNDNGERYQEDDPAWDLYNSCASKTGVIGSCATVLWVNSAQFQMQGVTVHNSATDAQGIAIKTTSDEVETANSKINDNLVILGAFEKVQLFGVSRHCGSGRG